METILLVDDNPSQLKALNHILVDDFSDCKIITAINETEAINALRAEKIDVVVTDMMMDGPDSGIIVLKEAKMTDPLTMVIIITALPKILDRKQAFELGAFDCLIKGSPGVRTADELTYKVRSALYTRKIALNLKHNDFLTKYFDPNVFKKIKENPDLLIPSSRTITVVFWDIRGFSSLNEKLKAHVELISGFLTEFLEAASRIVFKHEGVLDKFIGDGVMALFGAFDNDDPELENKNAFAAIKAAQDLRFEFNEILLKWSQVWSRKSPDTIDIGLGCGIHTGDAIVGNLGTELRDHFTAIGPHVNLTARIESTAAKNEIRFSSTTNSRVSSFIRTKKTDTLTNIKNITGTFDIYEISN